MTNNNLLYSSTAQIIANALGFLMFVGLFGIKNVHDTLKGGFLALFAELACVGCSAFSLIMNLTAQTTNSSLRRQTDLNIFLYGLYYLFSIVTVGYVYYWMDKLSSPPVFFTMGQSLKVYAMYVIISHTIIMAFYARLAWLTLIYVTGYPNPYGVKYIAVDVKSNA